MRMARTGNHLFRKIVPAPRKNEASILGIGKFPPGKLGQTNEKLLISRIFRRYFSGSRLIQFSGFGLARGVLRWPRKVSAVSATLSQLPFSIFPYALSLPHILYRDPFGYCRSFPPACSFPGTELFTRRDPSKWLPGENTRKTINQNHWREVKLVFNWKVSYDRKKIGNCFSSAISRLQRFSSKTFQLIVNPNLMNYLKPEPYAQLPPRVGPVSLQYATGILGLFPFARWLN